MSRGYFPDWDTDLALGEEQELRVEGILTDIRNGCTVEIKSDYFDNDRFFLEVQDRRLGRNQYRNTGFRTSKATLFVLNKPQLGILMAIRTETLRELEAGGLLGKLREGGQGGDCPTLGYVVTFAQLASAQSHLARRQEQECLFD